MKYLFAILFLISITISTFAQQNFPSLVSTAGNSAKAVNGRTLSYTIGQYAVFTMNNKNSYNVVNAYQMQTNGIQTKIKKNPEIKFDIKVYPNPTDGEININTTLNNRAMDTRVRIELFNLMGQRITSEVLWNNNEFDLTEKINFDIQHLTQGQYFIRILPMNSSNPVASFKIIKL